MGSQATAFVHIYMWTVRHSISIRLNVIPVSTS